MSRSRLEEGLSHTHQIRGRLFRPLYYRTRAITIVPDVNLANCRSKLQDFGEFLRIPLGNMASAVA
jgi:hypothetical protein